MTHTSLPQLTSFLPPEQPPISDVTTWFLDPGEPTCHVSNLSTSAILKHAPHFAILSQRAAEIIQAALTLHTKLNPMHASAIIRQSFVQWAWNITPRGELKDVAHLTAEDRGTWYALTRTRGVTEEGINRSVPVSTGIKRTNHGDEQDILHEKRVKLAEPVEPNPIDTIMTQKPDAGANCVDNDRIFQLINRIEEQENRIIQLEKQQRDSVSDASPVRNETSRNHDELDSLKAQVQKNTDDIIWVVEKLKENSDDVAQVKDKVKVHSDTFDKEKKQVQERKNGLAHIRTQIEDHAADLHSKNHIAENKASLDGVQNRLKAHAAKFDFVQNLAKNTAEVDNFKMQITESANAVAQAQIQIQEILAELEARKRANADLQGSTKIIDKRVQLLSANVKQGMAKFEAQKQEQIQIKQHLQTLQNHQESQTSLLRFLVFPIGYLVLNMGGSADPALIFHANNVKLLKLLTKWFNEISLNSEFGRGSAERMLRELFETEDLTFHLEEKMMEVMGKMNRDLIV